VREVKPDIDSLKQRENVEWPGSASFDHVAIDHSQLYRPMPRVTSNVNQSESPILNWPIGDVVNRVSPTSLYDTNETGHAKKNKMAVCCICGIDYAPKSIDGIIFHK